MFAVWLLVIIAIPMILGMTADIGISEILDDRKIRGVVSLVAGICAAVIVFVVYKIGIDSTKQPMYTNQSVKVYDTNGNLIEQYVGNVAVSGRRIIVEDKDSKKHIIYSNSGTIIIEEIE